MTPHEVIRELPAALTAIRPSSLSTVAQTSVRRVLDRVARRLLAEQFDPTNTTGPAAYPDLSTNPGKALPYDTAYSQPTS